MSPRKILGALAADVIAVLIFCAAGRRSHDEGLTVAGIAHTAWPFLTGTAAGWLASRAWRSPTSILPTGVVIWVSTIVVGMLLRKLSSQTVALSFIGVASAVTAVLLLGWRAALYVSSRRQDR